MSGLAPRAGILDIAPYMPGKAAVAGVRAVAKLSANESALGPSPKAISAFKKAAKELHRYPDGGAVALREAIGRCYGLDPARIVCGAGSDDLLFLLAHGYAGPGDEVIFGEHSFNMYPIIAGSVGAEPVAVPETDLTFDVDNVLARAGAATRIVFIANPNNPTGSYISADALKRLRGGLPGHVLLVVDSAYAEFVTGNDYSPGIELVDWGDNTVMTRTFSKIYGLAALRLGWAYCPPPVADVLNRLRGPFNSNVPAQMAGIAAVEDAGYIDRARQHNEIWRPWLAQRLEAAGLHVYPSAANFLLVQFPEEEARNALAAFDFFGRRGLITRETGGYGLPGCLRITIGLENEMRAIANALDDFMAVGEAG